MKTIILSLATVILLAAACGESSPGADGQAPAADGGLEEGGGNPFDIFGETGGGEDAEESDGTGTAADPCAMDPSSEACLCRNSRSRQCICITNPNDERCTEENKALAIRAARDQMECSVETTCDLKLKAAGGSGAYAWSLVEPPAHLNLVLEPRDSNERALVTATPSQAGTSSFTVTLTDTASGESTSKEIVVHTAEIPTIRVGNADVDMGFAKDPCWRLQVVAPDVTLQLGAEV